MVIIEAREWMVPPYANGFGNSVEQVEEIAGWENRSPGCYLSLASSIRTSQCREWNSCFTSFSFCLLQLETLPGIIADIIMVYFINKYAMRVT